ncbi:MAG: methyltransferase domain-containing protein [Candidatus Thiodiazotropha taylori]|nr:methyltransferase domain-containing protein [Candidatus Thiodiazotropha taylori]MCG8096928.1 methyltransferase domain-containing protein [Candidatus Thiodiazotropha endolucinida]MCG8109103.1 methyltransferase domain-containing protein [Candidatus Thiodiazotropha taylori]MCG8113374.1 methyltransferase domain-containing protein [Candidatus Thiodiazotropha taylori]MCW4281439.1 methyltransferase domain-containing protein [Candidatus Thiodiazotropha taylori]
MKSVEFGRSSYDYSRYRAGFPPGFFSRLVTKGILHSDSNIVDLGTGTGTIARSLAALGHRVIGIDISSEMLARAKELDKSVGVVVEYICSSAEDTNLPSETFQVITCGQCWHWFDRGRVAAECWRMLSENGYIVIAHFDWIPLPSNIVSATEALILDFNPQWTLGGGTGIYPHWYADLSMAGFSDLESWTFDESVSYSHEAWRGRIRASAGVGASLSHDEVMKFDTELSAMLIDRFPQEPLLVPHRVFTLVGKK